MPPDKKIQELIQQYGSDYGNIQTVRLGKLDGVTVRSDIEGVLWARQWNGREIKVHNKALVGAIFDLRVLVGIRRFQPGKWVILETVEDYLTPAGSGHVAFHEEQHEFEAADELPIDRKQIRYFSVRVSYEAPFTVQVYGGVFPTSTGMVQVDHQLLDMSGEVVTVGAVFVNIETDDTGVLSLNTGTNFGSIFVADVSYIPAPDPGKYLLASVLFYEGQTELLNEHIIVPMPLVAVGKDTGLEISEATADTPLSADEFGFWDVVDSLLKKITWTNIKATLKTYFDTLYSALGHTHASIFNDAEGDPADVSSTAASDGTSVYAARRDHVHYSSATGGGGSELLMESGVTSPPVPIENSDGDDWLYAS
jgi:hypothetical protein